MFDLNYISEAIDFLQGEHNTFYGYLLPKIMTIYVKMTKMKENISSELIEVVNAIISSQKTRFKALFEVNEMAFLSATLIPCVKMRWLHVFKEFDENVDESYVKRMFLKLEKENKHFFTNETVTQVLKNLL